MANHIPPRHARTPSPTPAELLSAACTRLRRLYDRLLQRSLPQQLLALGLGALFARAETARGMCPFGVAYAAAAGHPLPAAAGAFFSYLLSGRDSLVYAAAVMVTLTCRMVLAGTALSRRRILFPACAALTLLCTKGVVVLAEGVRYVLLLLCETALCLGFALMLREARDARSPLALWGRLTAALGVMLAFLPLTLWGTVSPSRLTGIFLTLSAGIWGGGAAGACVGLALGAGLDLSLGRGPLLALTWCISGLTAGLCGKRERLPAVLSACAAFGLTALWLTGLPAVRQGLLECFLASAALTLLPEKRLLALDAAFAGAGAALETGRRPAVGAPPLQGLSDAVAHLGAAMEALWQGSAPADPDLARVYRAACETACRTCKRRDTCWQQEQGDLHRLLADLSAPLREHHGLTPEQLPAWFTARCLRSQRFCGAVNDAYRAHLRRSALQAREQSLHHLMGRQYATLGALLEGLAARAGSGAEYDAVLESRIRRIVRAYLPRAKTAVCLLNGRLQIDLHLPEPADGDHSAMLRSLEKALDTRLLPPVTLSAARGTVLRIRQQEALSLAVYPAVRKKAGETVCGDCHLSLHTDDGRAVLLLSDGMGTGARAGELSRRALDLVRSFLWAGCSLAESTAAVLPVLAARFEEWGFVTLDLWEVSLFTGRATLLKYGAAPGFLLREGRRTRLDARALPAGLEPLEGPPPTVELRLREGDRLVLLSDGVWDSGFTEELLRDNGHLPGQALANLLLEEAARRGSADDMTVLVADLMSSGA